MHITRASKYTEHGCNIHGDLVVIKYIEEAIEASKLKPYGGFNSQTTLDYLDKAKKLATDTFGDVEIRLAVPDLVCRIKADNTKDTTDFLESNRATN